MQATEAQTTVHDRTCEQLFWRVVSSTKLDHLKVQAILVYFFYLLSLPSCRLLDRLAFCLRLRRRLRRR